MATAPQQKHLENPFQQQTDETDVFVTVGDEKLHLHSGILSFYSPVLREMFLNQQKQNVADDNMTIRLDNKKLDHVVTFFMFFYPEYQKKILHGLTMITDFYTIQAILFLSEKYEADWIPKQIDDLLCSDEYSMIISTYMEDAQETEYDRQIWGNTIAEISEPERTRKEAQILLLCDRFHLVNLIKNLKIFRNYGFQSMIKFKKLKSDTKLNIVMTRIQDYLGEIRVWEGIIEEISEGAYKVQHNANYSRIHLFGTKNNSDVIVKVRDHTLHLHSAILCHCSPVFKAMLKGNFKEATTEEIMLEDKFAEPVIALFRFCYSNNLQKLTASTNCKDLLSLCQEYQMDWLVGTIDKFLVKTKRYSNRNIRNQQHENVEILITGLKLADQFNLNELRKDILQIVTCLDRLSKTDGFSELAKSTKYQLARKSISTRLSRHLNAAPDRNEILGFLDEYFKDI